MSSNGKKIIIASDHAGYEVKTKLIHFLSELDYTINDLGCNSSQKSVDYPDFTSNLARNLTSESQIGILVCGSGIGVSIGANRHKHIRAALCTNKEMAKLSRQHNNANVICFGSRINNYEDIKEFLKIFLQTEFSFGRHEGRVEKLSK